MENKNDFYSRVAAIQKKIIVPKNHYNSFGEYSYRTHADILAAVKPLLGGLVLNLTDEIGLMGDRYYVKSTATISDGDKSIMSVGLARETAEAKKQSLPQLTGSASSYARKYALNGLFCIDDGRDPDSMDNTADTQKQAVTPRSSTPPTSNSGKDSEWLACPNCETGIRKTEYKQCADCNSKVARPRS